MIPGLTLASIDYEPFLVEMVLSVPLLVGAYPTSDETTVSVLAITGFSRLIVSF